MKAGLQTRLGGTTTPVSPPRPYPHFPHPFLSSLPSQAVGSLSIASLSAIPSRAPAPQPRRIRLPCLVSSEPRDLQALPGLRLPPKPSPLTASKEPQGSARPASPPSFPASPPPAPPPGRLAEEGELLSPPPPQLPTAAAAAAATAAPPGPTSRPSALTLPNRGALQRHLHFFLGVRDT